MEPLLDELAKKIAVLLESDQSDGAYVMAADWIDRLSVRLPPYRIAILRSFTIEPLIEALKVKLFLRGRRLELFLGQFNQFQQEILDPASPLYAFKPEITLVAVRPEELARGLFVGYPKRTAEELQQLDQSAFEATAVLLEALSRNISGSILLWNALVPTGSPQGLLDTQLPWGQSATLYRFNARLLELPQRLVNVYLFDIDRLASRIGKERFCDPLQWYRMAAPFALSAYAPLADALLRHLDCIEGRQKKCIVLDLDQTLWGGIVGEEGIQLSDSYPGNCFKDFQRGLKELAQRGFLLSINSKNNAEEALKVIRSHPEMILREEDFSAIRINWNDKAENLLEISQELNIGLDSMIFLDDNPAECERIRQAYPQVTVVQMPSEKHRYRSLLETLPGLDRLRITSEDQERGQLYQSQAKRQQVAHQSVSLQEFYASLQMQAALFINRRETIARVAQMTQKTNQFNLTTRWFTEAEIAQWMEKGRVYALSVEDRFGQNGIVAAAIVRTSDGGAWEIDSFLMSCRVVMRTIEDNLLSVIAQDAVKQGVRFLIGRYIPSGRNQMVANFFQKRGFLLDSKDGEGEVYRLDLTSGPALAPSPWILLKEEAELPQSP